MAGWAQSVGGYVESLNLLESSERQQLADPSPTGKIEYIANCIASLNPASSIKFPVWSDVFRYSIPLLPTGHTSSSVI